LPHQTSLLPIGNPFIELPTVDSTNNYAMALIQKNLAYHGAVVFAHQQTAGRGQRGKTWSTSPGENLILSIILQANQLDQADLFLLSAGVATACYDFFKNYAGCETSIKWPNDIYWRDRKAGGILIENVFRDHSWRYAVVGIGLNINQTSFEESLPNPVSLKQITGENYHPVQLAKELCTYLEYSYQQLFFKDHKILDHYKSSLYKLHQRVKIKKENIVFKTTIQGVTSAGKLITRDTMNREFDFGEVEWLL